MRKPNFNENVGSDLFARRGFMSGIRNEPNKKVGELPPHKIGGVGNFEIVRAGQQTQYNGNRFVDLDQTRSAGRMFSGTNYSGARFYEIDIPDPQDVTWIAEYARLEAQMLAAGNTPLEVKIYLKNNPPFGRPQRTIKTKRSMGSDQLTTENKLSEMVQEVKNGNVSSTADRAALAADLARIFMNANAINTLTQGELQKLGYLISNIGFKAIRGPPSPYALGITYRIIDKAYYSHAGNSGSVNVFIFAKAATSSFAPINSSLKNVFNATAAAGYSATDMELEANRLKIKSVQQYMSDLKTDRGSGRNYLLDLGFPNAVALIDEDRLMDEIKAGTIGLNEISIDTAEPAVRAQYPLYSKFIDDEKAKGLVLAPINMTIGAAGPAIMAPVIGGPGPVPLPPGPPLLPMGGPPGGKPVKIKVVKAPGSPPKAAVMGVKKVKAKKAPAPPAPAGP